MIVVDASVVLKWLLLDEPLSDAALAIRQAHEAESGPLACPELLFYEVANVLVSKSHLSLDDAIAFVKAVLEVGLFVSPFGEGDYPSAMRLAREHDLTVYDAAYVALARKLQCEFVTADLKLHRQLRHLKWVRLLE